ncbi:MAG: hypothetical protein SFV23_14155 [Planctomycetaceae bacterium]|nr:hypothetical protein [Planctomycetaceae bacterium]
MPESAEKLTVLHREFVLSRDDESRRNCQDMDRKHARQIRRLAQKGVATVGDLIVALPDLPASSQDLGIWLIFVLKIPRAASALRKLLLNPRVRVQVAWTLDFMRPRPNTDRILLKHGRRELDSAQPDRSWLDAAVQGLANSESAEAADMLVTIYERTDLPGRLRGDAADKLGCVSLVHDRRRRLYRRCRDGAMRGIFEDDIEVQFWSMYLLMILAKRNGRETHFIDRDLAPALPRLKQIAAEDHRLAPGYWWPMSAEAEDAISCIEHGCQLQPDAADRWIHNTERGEPASRGT